MNRLLALLAFLVLLAPTPVFAQSVPLANVVTTCGSQSLPSGSQRGVSQDTTGKACVSTTASATSIFQPATVGTSSAQVIGAGTANIYLMLHNPSAAGGNTVYCREGAAAAVATAGNLSIAPGQYVTMENSLVDGGAWNCIASGANTPFTYGAK